MRPDPSPPFHQISLPVSPDPLRKLQVVRFSTLTSFAFHTTMPLRPAAFPSDPTAPKLCWAGAALHGVEEPALVPSTITVPRSIPRRWMSDFVMRTPAKSPWWVSVGGLSSSSLSW